MSKEFDDFDVVANKIISDAIDDLCNKAEDLNMPNNDLVKFQMMVATSCMTLSRDLLRKYHEELIKHLRSKGI